MTRIKNEYKEITEWEETLEADESFLMMVIISCVYLFPLIKLCTLNMYSFYMSIMP